MVVHRVAALPRQLMTFSRKQKTCPEIIDVKGIIAYMAEMLRRMIPKNIKWDSTLLENQQFVYIDPGQLEQILMNLVLNSSDAMKNGGELTIQTADIAIDENASKDHQGIKPGNYVMMSVKDTGSGMDEETVSRIFEPFFTTKDTGEGTGLGLATVYGIIGHAGGHINVDSSLRHGSTFKIYLPTVAEKPDNGSSSKPQSKSMEELRGSESILFCEDDESIREPCAFLLNKLGYRVITAYNGINAIEQVEAAPTKIELLITDVMMPRMNGQDLSKELRKRNPDLKVIFTSGYPSEILEEYTDDIKGKFLAKPVVFKTLMESVREILDQEDLVKS